MKAMTRWVPVLSQVEKPFIPIDSQITCPHVSGLACVLNKNTLALPLLCFPLSKIYRNATYVKARVALKRSADFLVRDLFFFSSALFNSLNWSESRTLISQPLDNTSESNLTMFEYPPGVEPQFPNAFNREMTPEIAQEKMVGSTNVFSGMTDSVLIAEGVRRYLTSVALEGACSRPTI
jgi:hypothetical protein